MPTEEPIRQRILMVIASALGIASDQIDPRQPWAEPAGSIEMVELVMAVENAFEVKLTDKQVVSMNCLDDLVSAIVEQRGDDGAASVLVGR
jgi:acyl carrier protein